FDTWHGNGRTQMKSRPVIPYVCDQRATARLSRQLLSLPLLPATARLIGILVLRQMPSLADCAGIGAERRRHGALPRKPRRRALSLGLHHRP
ncbi:MAG TPA: hypothetical protein VHQ39_07095, partial [Dongiaceae bacterium]|nr:hypothetical protein [Dongiaceae bacterium]